MVTIGYGYKGYPDTYICFKRMEDVKNYLAHSTEATARFRAKDFVDLQTSESELNGVSHNDRNNLTIETPCTLQFGNNDLLLDVKFNLVWRVTNVQMVDDNQAKENSMRPRKLTHLTLIR